LGGGAFGFGGAFAGAFGSAGGFAGAFGSAGAFGPESEDGPYTAVDGSDPVMSDETSR
jgi:hypothetical protein